MKSSVLWQLSLFLSQHLELYNDRAYCNAVYYKLPKSRLSRLQQIQNSLARAVSCTDSTIKRVLDLPETG